MGQVVVTRDLLPSIYKIFEKEKVVVFDTETTGLSTFRGARMFSLALATGEDEYYFNFNPLTEEEYRHTILQIEEVYPIFSGEKTWVAQNTKFDIHMLSASGIDSPKYFSDTEVLGRIKEAHHWKYSLNDLAGRHLGEAKDDAVMNWLEENKAYTIESVPDKGDLVKNYHFDFVPFPLISKYAMKDARLTWDLYAYFKSETDPKCHRVVSMEEELIPVLYEMEHMGIQTDETYIKLAIKSGQSRLVGIRQQFFDLAGCDLVDSAECLAPIFEKLGYSLPKTEAESKSVTDEVLESIDNDIARVVQDFRGAQKRLNTYFLSFLYYADQKGSIHPSFRQAGTNTGRMSCRDPNLQNIPDDDGAEMFPVRRAFVPREGFFFLSLDWKQMEFRLMLDYANEKTLIDKINLGHDPHDATAEETGLERKPAKTLNFGILYGMGLEKLGKAIGCSKEEAKAFKYKYFGKLQRVKNFLDQVKWKWEDHGTIYNWLGRRYDLDDKRWSYKGRNKLIQGGCADIVKLAMIELCAHLNAYMSRIVLQVHDEILFEIHESEVHIVPELKRLMEGAYPHKHIPLTCSVAFSLKSFHDMVEIEDKDDLERTIRKALPTKGFALPQGAAQHVVL